MDEKGRLWRQIEKCVEQAIDAKEVRVADLLNRAAGRLMKKLRSRAREIRARKDRQPPATRGEE